MDREERGRDEGRVRVRIKAKGKSQKQKESFEFRGEGSVAEFFSLVCSESDEIGRSGPRTVHTVMQSHN